MVLLSSLKQLARRAFNIKFAVLIFIVLISSGAYLNTLSNDFVSDDFSVIVKNPWIKDVKFIPKVFLSHTWGFKFSDSTSNRYGPLRFIINMMQYRLFETRPLGYHLTNVIVHIMVTVIVFLIATSFFKQFLNEKTIVYPALATLLFAVHPIHTEVAAWATGISELFMSFFYLLSFLIYMNTSDTSEHKYNKFIISALLFFIAALFKVTAITLLFLIIIYDYSFKKGFFSGNLRAKTVRNDLFSRYMPFITATIVYLLLRTYAIKGFIPEEGYAGFNTYLIIINVFPLFSKYLEMLVLPVNLNFFHVFQPVFSLFNGKVLAALCITAIFMLFVFIARKKNNGLFFTLLWIIVPLIPVLYFPAFTGETVFAERYLYLPSVGFVMVVAILLRDIYYLRLFKGLTVPALFLGSATVIGLFTLWTVNRNYVWKDNYTLWMDTIKKSPYSYTAHNNLGNVYYRKGLLDDAIREYRIALALNPYYRDARYNLSVAYTIKNAINSNMK